MRFVIASVLFLVICYIACTNIQLGQTSQRFYDNMNLPLKSYGNISPTNPNVFSFAAIGDVHIGSSGGNELVHALQVALAEGDSFVVTAGDNSNTGQVSEMTNFETQLASVPIPVYPAIGNHDIFFGGWENYKSVIGHSIFSFNAGSVHFTFLDTANGTFGDEQLTWLKNDLASAQASVVRIVVMHFPIVNGQFSSIYKIASDEQATIFKSLMHQYGVQLVISGHFHGYNDSTVEGTRYLVSGACNNILEIGGTPEFVQVMINNGVVTSRIVGL